MQLLVDSFSSLVAFIGHFSLCVWLFNRLHAMPWPRPVIRWLERVILAFAAAVLLVYGLRALTTGVCIWRGNVPVAAEIPWLVYPALCGLAAVAVIPFWLIPKLLSRVPAALLSNDTTLLDLAAELGHAPIGSWETALFSKIPGNQIFHLAVQKKILRLPHLPPELHGLTIAHLSDLHMTGKLSRDFFEEVVRRTNQLEPDLVVITGDIAEKVHCLDWIVPVLGALQAPCGKFFILGNHETKLPDAGLLRLRMRQAGFTDVGGQAIRVPIRGADVLIAGSEVPWFGKNPELPSDVPCPPSPVSSEHGGNLKHVFRLLLSHSPDQLPWARKHNFDLMLSGHTHGGQIRLPFIGALISPSHYGFRYAGGLYQEEPTLLHVSRGICGDHPIRLNCPPELPLLTLVSR